MRKLAATFFVAAVFAVGLAIGAGSSGMVPAAEAATAGDRVFELRTYTTHEGRLDALHGRFRHHTVRLFEKHGITSVGYWVPEDPALAGNTLVFLLSYPDRDAARASWESFRADPEWLAARAASEADGPIVRHVHSVYANPTDYSRMR
jgi:hypothetical protein